MQEHHGVLIQTHILMSREEICQVMRISKGKFYKLVAEGLPVKKRAGQWSGHLADIENFFRQEPEDGRND